jgi:hypothetical protein
MDTFTRERLRLLGTKRTFRRHGQAGTAVSDALPHLARIVDDIAVVRSMVTDAINHAPGALFWNTGSTQFGRPSMGAWVTYALGSETDNLPAFVVLQSGPQGPIGGTPNWGSGFLPASYQGVPFRSGGQPVLNLTAPPGVSHAAQADTLKTLQGLNALHAAATGDPEVLARMTAYELAGRMQSATPELLDLSTETTTSLAAYGAEPGKHSFANNCLLARRLVERGVRFVQLYHSQWDHHGRGDDDIEGGLLKVCGEIDQPVAALVRDLKQRGLLDTTLVVWGGEFGRTPMGEMRERSGRNHHNEAFTVWLAGGGIKSGLNLGRTDDLGFGVIEDRVHVHDLQATLLYLLGLDHLRLTYRWQGRDFRLTDVGGEVVTKLLASPPPPLM